MKTYHCSGEALGSRRIEKRVSDTRSVVLYDGPITLRSFLISKLEWQKGASHRIISKSSSMQGVLPTILVFRYVVCLGTNHESTILDSIGVSPSQLCFSIGKTVDEAYEPAYPTMEPKYVWFVSVSWMYRAGSSYPTTTSPVHLSISLTN